MRKTIRWRMASLVAILTLLEGPAAFAHAHLITSRPAAGSELAAAPSSLVLNFTEPLEPAFVRIELSSAGKAVVTPGSPELGAAHKSVTLPLPVLGPGLYDVAWHVVSTDGHRTEGRFEFRVGTP